MRCHFCKKEIKTNGPLYRLIDTEGEYDMCSGCYVILVECDKMEEAANGLYDAGEGDN